MSWKIGQKLVCVDDTQFLWPNIAPKKGEVVTYDAGDEVIRGYDVFFLKEYNYRTPSGYRIMFAKFLFVPVNNASAKSELIEKFVEVEEKSDCPIQVPETV